MKSHVDLGALFACRLCWRITAAVFALILAVESAILVPSAQRFERAELGRIADRAVFTVEHVLALRRAGGDGQVTARDLAALVEGYRLSGLALFRSDGTLIARAGNADLLRFPARIPSRAMAEPFILSHDGRRLETAWRSAAPGAPVVVANLDASRVREALVAYVWRIAGLIAIIVLVVTAGTMLVLHLAVLRPLLRLRDSSRNAGADPDAADRHAVRTRRRDEIGELIAAHNAMLARVAESKRRDREHAAERERFLERHEPLTGLPNRAALLDYLDCQRGLRGNDARCVTLYLVNLLQFRVLNASVGKQGGDVLLRECARRLQRAAELGDFVAHLGADRFAVVRAGAACSDRGVGLAERILREAGAAYDVGDSSATSIAMRIGIAQDPDCASGGQTLLSQAELALARARSEEGAAYQFFSPALAEEVKARQRMTRDLEQAIEKGELFPVYQPKMSLEPDGSATLSGAETLLRWKHPERGIVSPGVFIPLAESTGLIVPIGDFVLRAACDQIRDWRDRFGWSPRLAVNLSAKQFTLPDLEQRLRRVLAETGVPPELLELEVTETAAMKDVAKTAATLQTLRSLRLRVSIDDFGTGYSSLSYLRRFAVDAIKIDKSFVDDIGEDRSAEAICDAILRLGQSLGTKVIAEGVEQERQLAFLRLRRCDEVQGYIFGKPVPAEEFESCWIVARAAA